MSIRLAAAEPLAVRPAEAIEYFGSKGYHTAFDWQDTAAAMHVRSFTVAKMMEVDLLRTVQDALDDAIRRGTPYEQFAADMEPLMRRKGWWGRKTVMDPRTGEMREVQLGSPARLRTIFDANVRTAYAEGQWQRIERVADRMPYLRYSAVLDARTRPHHRAWHGIILPVDHPFWETHFPPNGWNCRCGVQQLGGEDLEANGWQVSRDPAIRTRSWTNRNTNRTYRVPVGIDPGWDHNVGKTNLRVRTRQLLAEKVQALPELAADASMRVHRGMFEGRAFRDFMANVRAGQETWWPAGAVSGERLKEMGLGKDHPRLVDITPDTASQPKHRERWKAYSADDWARVQTMLDNGRLIIQGSNKWKVEMNDAAGKPWMIGIKRTVNAELLLSTYHRIQPEPEE